MKRFLLAGLAAVLVLSVAPFASAAQHHHRRRHHHHVSHPLIAVHIALPWVFDTHRHMWHHPAWTDKQGHRHAESWSKTRPRH